ncbi:hypothetical protein DPMN_038733 [Dreissena polymorpha]|uniref:Uncharacterized protein n=1 Tax=Dreissena polymorpha TaxID=45954 RepID=A0A9D4MDB0_DREPO|nr:hypothetical protein DPMN_038733 [Dreissena polymorpha]
MSDMVMTYPINKCRDFLKKCQCLRQDRRTDALVSEKNQQTKEDFKHRDGPGYFHSNEELHISFEQAHFHRDLSSSSSMSTHQQQTTKKRGLNSYMKSKPRFRENISVTFEWTAEKIKQTQNKTEG